MIEPEQIKRESEEVIINFGGKTCDWLPHLDTETRNIRSRNEIVGRALVLNAMINIYFQAPIHIIKNWLYEHNLSAHLSINEKKLLEKTNEELTEQESINLYWYIEALWALMWAGKVINEIPFDRCVEDSMASKCPNIEKAEGTEKFTNVMEIRSEKEIFKKLDLYFRLHWWVFDAHINGYSSEPVELSIVLERRKALEWVMNKELDWDDVPLDT